MNNYNKVSNYIKNNFNVLIVGPAGTGKTSIVKQVCNDLGYKIKYLDASLADAFVDLVGIPVPNHEEKIIEFFQTNDLVEAEVIVVDELNRGSRDFRNGILEAALEKSLKGAPLPNLKLMVAMMNPAVEGYHVDELDTALVDRFDARLYFDPYIDVKYFTDKYNREVAKATKKWWDDYNAVDPNRSKNNKLVYISPRRMDKVVAGFQAIPTMDTIRDFMPEGVSGDIRGLYNALNIAFGFVSAEDIEEENRKKREALRLKNKVTLDKIPSMSPREIRTTKSDSVAETLENADNTDPNYDSARDAVFSAISSQVGPDRLTKTWATIIKDHFTPAQRKELRARWAPNKLAEYNRLNKVGDSL